jgi:hypothetical protein
MIKGGDLDKKCFALNEQLKKRESCNNDLLKTIARLEKYQYFRQQNNICSNGEKMMTIT